MRVLGWLTCEEHVSDTIFATWFTYGADGRPLWLWGALQKGEGGVFDAALMATAGPSFNAVPFDPAKVTRTTVGNATPTFNDGNAARVAYTANAVRQSEMITRELFNPPAGTVCQ